MTKMVLFLDKLGERCAYERTGVRLYQLLLGRFEGVDEPGRGPTVAELRENLAEEASHYDLLVRAIEAMGADPAALTPCADSLMASGVFRVLSDPRRSPAECVQAALVVERSDRDGWELLIELAQGLRLSEMADEFARALTEEERHLVRVRRWLGELKRAEARLRVPTEPRDPMQLLREQRRGLDALMAELGGGVDA